MGIRLPSLPPLILASTSPFRRELLERLRLPFSVQAPGVEEAHRPGEPPAQRAARLSLAKAMAVAPLHPGAAVIGCDQVAVCGTDVLDKPGDAEGCRSQLQRLSGNSAHFYSAVTVVCVAQGFRDSFLDITNLQFRKLSAAEIDRYIAADQPFHCAGSFRSESLGVSLFERMQSTDPGGLVGLPLIRLAESLRALGFALP
jgi:septum formation protein